MTIKVESFADGTAMLLCTGCGKLVELVVTAEDQRGGASICEDCIAKAWDAIDDHVGTYPSGGGLTEVC